MTTNRWWDLTRLAVATPVVLFALVRVTVDVFGPADVSPVTQVVSGLWALSFFSLFFLFVVATSEDKAFLAERTDEATPRSPRVIGLFLLFTAGLYAPYYLVGRWQKYGWGRGLLSVAHAESRRVKPAAVGVSAAITRTATGLVDLAGRLTSTAGADGATSPESPPVDVGAGVPTESTGRKTAPSGDDRGQEGWSGDDRPRTPNGRHSATDGQSGTDDVPRPFDPRREPPVEPLQRTSMTLTYESRTYRCTALASDDERWGLAWETSTDEADDPETRLFTLQWGSRHETVRTGDVLAGDVATDGTFAVVDSLDPDTGDDTPGVRLRAFTHDGEERFGRRFVERVGTPVVSPGVEYVGVVERHPSRLVLFETDTGDRAVEQRLETVPDAVEFRRHDGEWWVVGGESGRPPSFGLRLDDGELVR